MPRSSSHASVWPRMVPSCARMVRSFCQYSSSRAPTRAPAMMSEWPLRYLVAECMTMSAPNSIGRVSTGVPTVESTPSSAPARWAMSAAAAMSVTHQVGLAGVSIHTSLVRRAAWRRRWRRSGRRRRNRPSGPIAVAKPASQLRSDQYITLGATTWPPGASARKQAVAALMPEEKISALGPPSSAASVASAWSKVGLSARAYCGRSRSRCPRRADRCWPCGSAARRPSSQDRSTPLLVLRAKRQRRSCLSSGYRQLRVSYIARALYRIVAHPLQMQPIRPPHRAGRQMSVCPTVRREPSHRLGLEPESV